MHSRFASVSSSRLFRLILALILLSSGLSIPQAAHAAGIIYVKVGASGLNNGTSWTNAYTSLQNGLKAAAAGDQIWVARGVYKPSSRRAASDPRSASFTLKDGVAIYGGFVGHEVTLTQRNWTFNPTILSGDLDSNDLNTDANAIAETWSDVVGANAYNVVVGENLGATSILDGLIVTAGYADHPEEKNFTSGGGIRLKGGAAQLKHLLVSGNTALYYRYYGGGIYMEGGAPALDDVTVRGNYAYGGGGINIFSESNPTISNSTIEGNYARTGGGGIMIIASSLTLNNVVIHNNLARSGGGLDAAFTPQITLTDVRITGNREGGLSVLGSQTGPTPQLVVTNSVFSGNYGDKSGGGAAYLQQVQAQMTNVLITGNYAYHESGGINITGSNSTLILTNATIAGNRTPENGVGLAIRSAPVTLRNSIVLGIDGSAYGTPPYVSEYSHTNVNVDPKFVNPRPNAEAPTTAGDYHLATGSLGINSGLNSFNTLPTDLDHLPRIVNGTIDMGPYEVQKAALAPRAGVTPGAPSHFLTTPAALPAAPSLPEPPEPAQTAVLQPSGTPIYVNAAATGGTNNGSSWANAYLTLQQALDAATGANEIWVAAGIYYPSLRSDPGDARTATFTLKDGVSIYGGFNASETTRDQRNPALYTTILSGDIDQNDLNPDGNFIAETGEMTGDNAAHVLMAKNINTATTLDGFVITAGLAKTWELAASPLSLNGGGMWVQNSSALTLSNLMFSGNRAHWGGGLFLQYHANPTLTHVVFQFNMADEGGGVYIEKSSAPLFSEVKILRNFAYRSGAGASAFDLSTPVFNDTLFESNWADYGINYSSNGGGLVVYYDSNVSLNRTHFFKNEAEGAGAILLVYSRLTFKNGELRGNWARTNNAGALEMLQANADLVNTVITGNTSRLSGGAISLSTLSDFDVTTLNLTHVTMTHNLSYNAGYSSGIMLWSGVINLNNTILYQSPIDITSDVLHTVNCNNCIRSSVTDPLFVAPSTQHPIYDISGDYHLQVNSPAVNAGSNALIPPGITTDLDGLARIVGGTVDLGAYEVQPVAYVKANASGLNNGSSWANAYTSLQTALANAPAGQEIWVAAGIYKPSTPAGRAATFALKNSVHLYGGFAGNELGRGQRNPAVNLTVLSGDLGGNDAVDASGVGRTLRSAGDASGSDNAYHVLTCADLTQGTVVDGFVVTNGFASGIESAGQGGGMLVKNCANFLWLENMLFSGNLANRGGGVYTAYSSPTLRKVRLATNRGVEAGGGMYTDGNSNPLVRETLFSGNAAVEGGALYNLNNQPSLVSVLISGNSATRGGGIYNNFAAPRLSSSTLASNYASEANGGGALYNFGAGATPTLTNAIVWGNLPNQARNNGGSTTVSYSDVQGGAFGTGNLNLDPLFRAPLAASATPQSGGDYHTRLIFSPVVDAGSNTSLTFTHNGSLMVIAYDLDGNPRVADGNRDGNAKIDMGAYEQTPKYVYVPTVRK